MADASAVLPSRDSTSKAGPTKAAPRKPAPGRPSASGGATETTENQITPVLNRQQTEAVPSSSLQRESFGDSSSSPPQLARAETSPVPSHSLAINSTPKPSIPDRKAPEAPRTEPRLTPAGSPQAPSNYYALLKEKYEQEQAEKRRLEEQKSEQPQRSPSISTSSTANDNDNQDVVRVEDTAPPPPAEDEPPPPPESNSFQAIIASHKALQVKQTPKAPIIVSSSLHSRQESDVPPPPAPAEEQISVSTSLSSPFVEGRASKSKSSSPIEENQPIYRDLERGELIVKIFKGRDLKARKPMCKLRLEFSENFQQQTRVLDGSFPGFMQEFTISKKEWPFSSRLHIEVWDVGLIKNFLGSIPFEWPPSDPGYSKGVFTLTQKGKTVGNIEICVIDTAICSSKGQIEALCANTALYGMDQYDGKGLLGEGGGGVVRMIVRKIDQACFAVKVITKKHEVDARTEIEIMSMLNHPHCIKLAEMIEMKSNLYLIMPFMAGGSLGERQQTRNSKSFSEKESRRYVQEIASGLVYLHSQGIVHRDIKPENLMFTGPEKSASVKICDFGLATYKKQVMEEGCGTAPFLAPEIVRQQPYGKEVDLWALGVVVYYMLVGRLPFDQTNQKLLLYAIRNHDFTIPMELSGEAKHLIKSLMEPDAQRRLTAEEVLLHPFVLGVSLDNFVERKPEENELAHVSSKPESAVVPKARNLFEDDEDNDDAVSLFKKAKAQSKSASASKAMPSKSAPRVRATSPSPKELESPPPFPRQLSMDTEPPPPPPED